MTSALPISDTAYGWSVARGGRGVGSFRHHLRRRGGGYVVKWPPTWLEDLGNSVVRVV